MTVFSKYYQGFIIEKERECVNKIMVPKQKLPILVALMHVVSCVIFGGLPGPFGVLHVNFLHQLAQRDISAGFPSKVPVGDNPPCPQVSVHVTHNWGKPAEPLASLCP